MERHPLVWILRSGTGVCWFHFPLTGSRSADLLFIHTFRKIQPVSIFSAANAAVANVEYAS